jgi:cell wall-associated NlpC family hydrolase
LQPADPDAVPAPAPSPSSSVEASPSPSPSPSDSPSPPADHHLTFTDLPATDAYYPEVDLAVRLGWMEAPGGAFRPNAAFTKWYLDLTLVKALGLGDVVAGLTTIRTANGYSFKRSSGWAAEVLAHELRLHYNHSTANDSLERFPTSTMDRAHVAWSLVAAVNAAGSWRLWSARQYSSIVLPAMDSARLRALQFAFDYVGYPYIYGGEWYRPTFSGYCCGAQPVGGFDCSGLTWWTLHSASASYPVTRVRPYAGWSLPYRTSYDMARYMRRVTYAGLKPLDLMFFQSELGATTWPSIDHVGMYIGNGWMIHSSGGRDGVTLSPVGDGWWHDHFKWGARVIPG